MPLVEIKVFKDELDQDQSKELITKITDAVTEVTSDKLRGVTSVEALGLGHLSVVTTS